MSDLKTQFAYCVREIARNADVVCTLITNVNKEFKNIFISQIDCVKWKTSEKTIVNFYKC